MSIMVKLGVEIPSKLFDKVKAVSSKIVGMGSDGLLEVSEPLTNIELKSIRKVLAGNEVLLTYENTLNWFDLTVEQVNIHIDNNVTDLASARTYLKKLSSVVLFLLQKEVNKGNG